MRLIKKISIIILALLSLNLVSCKKGENIDFEANNQIFFNTFVRMNVGALGEEEFRKIDIIHVEGYYLDTYYYYNIEYHRTEKDYDLLYVLRFNSLNEFFPISNEDDCYEYFPNTYSKYLAAKEKGTIEEFDDTKIELYLNNAFEDLF